MGTALPMVDVERIRVEAERDAYANLEWEERRAQANHVAQDVPVRRRQLLANALLLTETMAPEAHDAARHAMAALGVEDHIELFQTGGHGTDTARLVLYGQPIGVEFIGAYLDRLDPGGLLAVLGHEIGHSLAHSGHSRFGWALPACERGNTLTKRAYSIAAEFTADRFGLLACRDLDAVLRLEMQMSAGRSAKSIRFDTKSYLEQCRAVAEETIARGGIVMGSTHPEHYVRGYAEWLFSETDVYASITGIGPSSRALDEVDAILQKLLGIPRRRATVIAPVQANQPRDTGSASTWRTNAVAGEREGEVAARSALPLEDPGIDILTEGARRTLAATGRAIAAVARAAAPSIRDLADAARAQFGSSEADSEPSEDYTTGDPLEDDRRELIARFEELERRAKGK